MVSQLELSALEISIEICAFRSDKLWKNYDYIIADIFDHLIAAVSYFELELFEQPSKAFVKEV